MLIDVLSASAGAFDVDAATRAYLDTLQGSARARSDAYFEGGYWILLWGTLVAVVIDWLLLRFKIARGFRNLSEKWFVRPFAVTWLTALFYLLATTIITLPWTIYTGYFREKQYDLMELSFGAWASEQVFGLAVLFVLGPLGIAIVYSVIRRLQQTWWVVATALVGVLIFVATLVAPVFIAPMFNTFTELEDGPLRDRIVAMAQEHDVPSDSIRVFDQSKQHKRISANVSGFGPTAQISLNDNLLERTSEEEIVAVMAHEIGHYVMDHGPWRVATTLTVFGLCMFIVSRIVPLLIGRFGERWGIHDPGDPASIPVYAMTASVVLLLATPAFNNIVRLQEAQADAFGLAVSKEPDGFARVSMRLNEYRKLEPKAIEEFLFNTHPSGKNRVRRSMQWKADNLPNPVMIIPAEGYLDQ